ncbi:MAG: SusC/RagA family TonB-linked outer membrane protein [Flavobacteriales bacterium]
MNSLKSHLILLLALGLSIIAYGQKTISGSVISTEKEPIPFANIYSSIDQSSANGDGLFSIKVSDSDTHILVSAVGFSEDSVAIIGDYVTAILVESAVEIDDAVVTALGIKREKKSIGYAITELKSKDIELNSDPSVVNRLAGKVAGLNISSTNGGAGTSSRIILRGNNSLSRNSQALIVVDGVPINNNTNSNSGDEWGGKDYGNGVSDINPDDVESISVLKGASASALYGSAAKNGVILISTKSGGKKLRVNFSSRFTVESPYILYDLQNKYGAGRNGKFEGAWNMVEGTPVFSTATDFSKGSWGPEMTGQTIVDWDGNESTFTPQQDNYKDFFRLGSIWNNSISIEGRVKGINLRFSASNNKTNDIIPGATLNRNNLSLKFVGNISKKLSLNGYVSYVQNKAVNRPGLSDSHDNPNRNFIHMPRHISTSSLENYTQDEDGNEVTWYGAWNWMTNPYWNIQNQRNGDTRNRVLGNVSLSYKFSDKLTATLRTSPDSYTTEYFNVNAQQGLISSLGDYSTNIITQNLINTDFLIRYQNQFSEKFKYFLNFGGNAMYWERTTLSQNTSGGLIEPDVYSLENSVNPIFSRNFLAEAAKNSLYAFGQLEYDGFLYLDLTTRNDWSSTLPEGQNSFLYSSASLGFVYSELFNRDRISEKFFSFGKIRMSYAGVGNDPDPYQDETTYIELDNEGFGPSQLIGRTVPNLGIVPELDNSVEIGSETKFWHNRLGIDFTWYHNTSFNQISTVPLSAASGYAFAVVNSGIIVNRGIELQLNVTPVQKKNFEWNANIAYAKNYSEVKELGENVESSILYEHWRLSIEARPGNPYGDIVGFGFLRDETGNVLVDQNGMAIKDATPKVLGNFTPDFMLSLSQNFTYKNWTASVLIHSQFGGDMFSGTNMYGNGYAGNFVESLEGREERYASEAERELAGVSSENWTPTGGQLIEGVYAEGTVINGQDVSGQNNQTYVNPFDYYERVSRWQDEIHEPFIYDASFIKLREMSIGYNVPTSVAKKLKLRSLNIGIFGSNLWLIHSNVPNIDPESSLTNGNGQGYELYAYPNRRSFGMYFKVSI